MPICQKGDEQLTDDFLLPNHRRADALFEFLNLTASVHAERRVLRFQSLERLSSLPFLAETSPAFRSDFFPFFHLSGIEDFFEFAVESILHSLGFAKFR